MFKRVGTPVLIDEVVDFDSAKAESVMCPSGNKLGLRSAGLFKAAGTKTFLTPGALVQCTGCGETTNV